jgi:GntR family transcriptional regulator
MPALPDYCRDQPTYRDLVEIDHHGETAIYQQLAAILRAQIASGELEAGRPIPSEQTLAQRYGISRLTARKAVSLLRDEGLVRHAVGRGTFVVPPS